MQTFRFLLVLILCVTTQLSEASRWGYRFNAIGIGAGLNFHKKYYSINGGLYFDRFNKSCIGVRTFEGFALEYGKIFSEDFHSYSAKITKGFIRPFHITRRSALHPVVSLNASYSDHFSLRPEAGVILITRTGKVTGLRLITFYGYELPFNENVEPSIKGSMFGLRLSANFNLINLKKKPQEN